MRIGPYQLNGNFVVAPMAGVTDAAFRAVCLKLGAAWAVGEMAASGSHLLGTEMTRRRYACDPREAFPVVQIGRRVLRRTAAPRWSTSISAVPRALSAERPAVRP